MQRVLKTIYSSQDENIRRCLDWIRTHKYKPSEFAIYSDSERREHRRKLERESSNEANMNLEMSLPVLDEHADEAHFLEVVRDQAQLVDRCTVLAERFVHFKVIDAHVIQPCSHSEKHFSALE